MTVITISPAGPGDAEPMAALLEEMDLFYGADALGLPRPRSLGDLEELRAAARTNRAWRAGLR